MMTKVPARVGRRKCRLSSPPPPTTPIGFARAASDSSNALANLEFRLASASFRNNKDMAQEFVRVIDALRDDDRQATEALFDKLQKQYTTDFVMLRRDLETLASTTDEEIESARAKLYQLASNQNP